MTYPIKSICRQYGISKEEIYRAINNESINADDKGDLIMDATLNAFLKRYRELAVRIPKKATVITEDDAGRVYNDGATFYAVKSDYTILVTNDLMTANRYITPKEKPLFSLAYFLKDSPTSMNFALAFCNIFSADA